MCFAIARMPSEWRNRILVLCAKVSGIVGVVRRNSKVKGWFLRLNQNDFGGSSTIFRHVNAGLYSTSHGHSFVSRNIWQNHFHLYCDLCA